jgi:hypothetical protein
VAAPNRLGLSARTGCVGSAGALRVVIEAVVDTGAIRDIRQRLRATAQSQDERDRRNNIRVAQPREKSVQHQALQSMSACTPPARVADRRVSPTRRTFWGEASQRAVVQSRVLEEASIDDATVFRTGAAGAASRGRIRSIAVTFPPATVNPMTARSPTSAGVISPPCR